MKENSFVLVALKLTNHYLPQFVDGCINAISGTVVVIVVLVRKTTHGFI